MKPHSPCPTSADLQRLVLGQIPESEEVHLAQHVAECRSCDATLQSLKVSDTLLEAIRAQAAAPLTAMDALAGLLERVLAAPDLQTTAAAATGSGSSAADTSDPCSLLAPPQSPDEIGRLGPYRVVELLGRGGMGVVFRAEDTQLKRPVALKAMKPELAERAGARQRFLREAQAAAAVRHDHIVTIYQVGQEGDVPFLAMELLEGETLDRRLERAGKLCVPEVLRLGRAIAEGLDAAHRRGLVHRDIKPANIFLSVVSGPLSVAEHQQGLPTDDGPPTTVKLLDFGLARVADQDASLTEPGTIIGTPAYMAPEQARGEAVDARSDLFSLGCVLYRMCTGKLPFRGTDTMSLLTSLAVDQPRPPRELNPAVPPALSALVMELLAKRPAARPASAAVVAARLAGLERAEERPIRSRWRDLVRVAAGILGMAIVGLLVAQLIIRITDKEGKTREIETKPGEKIEIVQKGPTEPRPSGSGLVRPDKDRPFLLIRKGGQHEEFKHASEALAVLQDGDTLEIHGNGPFQLPHVTLNSDLTIKAAPGYRPRLVPHESVVELTWLEVNGTLTVEGCDFRSPMGFSVKGSRKPWRLSNCRFLFVSIHYNGPKLQIEDCLLTHPVFAAGGEVELCNNVLWLTVGNPNDPGYGIVRIQGDSVRAVRLENNTFIAAGDPVGISFPALSWSQKGNAPVTVTARGNLFNTYPIIVLGTDKPEQVRERVRWEGQDNLYADHKLLVPTEPKEGKWPVFDLAGWNEFWGRQEPGSRLTGPKPIRFAWDALSYQDPAASIDLLKQAVKQSRDRQGAVDLNSLGPDWDLVGPGEAYVRALEKESGQRIPKDRLRPSGLQGGPFVIIRDGQTVRGYFSLAQAAGAARADDIIEIRTDGPVAGYQDIPIPRLTIRAAPGYRPVVLGNIGHKTELIVEGLHFRSVADNGDAVWCGTLVRCANCSFEGPRGEVVVTPSPQRTAEVVNCLNFAVVNCPPNCHLILRNSVVRSTDPEPSEKPSETRVDIERCIFWNPTCVGPGQNFGYHPSKCKPNFVVRNSLFEAGGRDGVMWDTTTGVIGRWQGTGNVYRQGPARFREYLTWPNWTEKGSLELDPLIFDPRSWRLLPSSAGYRQRPDGKDFGAEVERVAR